MTLTLGLRANAPQFALLVGVNLIVGASVGLERSVLPLVAGADFGIASRSAALAFIATFGAAKALGNLAAGRLADRRGRKAVLVAGWALALPAAPLIGLAPSWGFVVAANLFLGASQGLTWSMTVLMKIDLAGPRRRGLALGLNESAGYLGVAATAALSGALAASVAPRTVVWVGLAALTVAGIAATIAFVCDTQDHVRLEAEGPSPLSGTPFTAIAQAGFANNLNDAAAWGLVPLVLAAHGASAAQVGAVAGLYPAVWGLGQVPAGALSDTIGRTPCIVAGMLVQSLALAGLAAAGGAFAASLAAAALLGAGTALVYPTLIAAVTDRTPPADRGRAVGAYRFWRDAGLVAGALGAGALADAVGSSAALAAVAAFTAASGGVYLAAAWTGESAGAQEHNGETSPSRPLRRR